MNRDTRCPVHDLWEPDGKCTCPPIRKRKAHSAVPAGSANFTLTAQEIRHLAQFCGMVIQESTASEAEDECETEIIIAPWPEKGVQGDDGMLPPHKHIAYLEEYPEEGCVPLGSPNEKGQR